MRQMPCLFVGYMLRRHTNDEYAKVDYKAGTVGNGGALDFLAGEDILEEVK